MKTAFLSTLKGKIIIAAAGVALIGAIVGLASSQKAVSMMYPGVNGNLGAAGRMLYFCLLKIQLRERCFLQDGKIHMN